MRSNGSISLQTAKIRQQTKRFFPSRSPQESSLEKKDIHSIRSSSRRRGIEPYLRQISNTPLLSREEEVEVTWEDMVEVEQAPSYLFKKNDPTKVATEESSNQVESDLEEAISRISELEGSNEELKEARTKAENFLFEFKKHSDELGGEPAETVERIAKQKADAQVLLAGSEGPQFELEEKGFASDSGIAKLQKILDAAQLDWNVTRLDLEAQRKPRSPSHWSSQFQGLVSPRNLRIHYGPES